MARQTRAQRRARRQQQAEEQTGNAQRTRVRQQAPPAEPVVAQPVRERRGFIRFVGESWGELQKVEWPTQSHVIQGTVVVLIACIIVGTYLWLADIASKHIVENLLLR